MSRVFATVRHHNIYPGVDVVYHGNQREMEYDFVVEPHADPSVIQLEFEGADKLDIDVNGDLVLHLGNQTVRQRAPVIYQDDEAGRHMIAGNFVVDPAKHRVGFYIGPYDRSRTLVIDPSLAYSTYSGGTGDDTASDIKIVEGHIYITGYTGSANFPTSGALQRVGRGGLDVFVSKLTLSGNKLEYSTYLGGTANDLAYALTADRWGNAIITGTTGSADFPSRYALQPAFRGADDVFVVKLNRDGSELLYSTYLGGSGFDWGFGVTADLLGNAMLTGYTGSLDFPMANAVQTSPGGWGDAFVTKITANGSALVYSTISAGAPRILRWVSTPTYLETRL